MALSSNRELQFYASRELVDIPVDDNVNIHKGALAGINSSTGYARPLIAGDNFAGVAYAQADNTVAGHSAGGITVRLHQEIDIIHTLTGVSQTNIGSAVYASNDETLTLTASGNSRVGRIVAIEGTNLVRVRCQPIAST